MTDSTRPNSGDQSSAAIRCDTKGCPNEPTERVPDSTSPHVIYDLCASCAAGMRALQGVELIDTKNLPPLTFEPIAAAPEDRPIRKWSRSYQYGRSRANRWPLWISWLLAPSKSNRRIVRELMQLRKDGLDV